MKQLKIKFTPYRKELGTIYHRQTKGHSLESLDGHFRFYIDEDIPDPDFWVVQGKGVRSPQTCHVAPENTIFLATEPASVLIYPKDYLKQFGHVCTPQEKTHHPHLHLTPAILPWFIGFTEDKNGNTSYTKDYDFFASAEPQKTKMLSVICSDKAFTKGHIERLRFVEKLKQHFGNDVDVFGRGFNDFADKWDVLAPYRYHIVIENSCQKYYWTEKVGDCYLASTFPFYYGCTNLSDYFPTDAFCPIDIKHPEEAFATIEEQMQKNIPGDVLMECRDKMLNEYNMFEFIARFCSSLDASLPKHDVTIDPCRSAGNLHNMWRYTVERKYYTMKNNLRCIKK